MKKLSLVLISLLLVLAISCTKKEEAAQEAPAVEAQTQEAPAVEAPAAEVTTEEAAPAEEEKKEEGTPSSN